MGVPPRQPDAGNGNESFEMIPYDSYVDREDSRNISLKLRLLSVANAGIAAFTGVYLLLMIVLDINRGDNIFPIRDRMGPWLLIPWTQWHEWLESISLALGVLVGFLLAALVASAAILIYYRERMSPNELQDVFAIAAQAWVDGMERKEFKEKFRETYKELLEGKLPVAPSPAGPAPGKPSVAPVPSRLPSIKPPPMGIASPGMMKLPVPKPGAPPPIPGTGIKKKVPAGPITGEKKIIVRCEKCARTLQVMVPKRLVLDNELEVVPISIIHGEGENKHVLTVYLDPDFKSRRDRVSDLIVLE